MRKFFSHAIILFILLLVSGASTLSNNKTIIIIGWLFFFGVYLYIVREIRPLLIILPVLFIGISVLYYLRNDAYNEVTYLGFFMNVFLAYFCRGICDEDFFDYYVNIIYVLTCITIPFFIIQLINFDVLFTANNLFGAAEGNEIISSSLFFAMVEIHRFRNCGFMWEPGAFAAILILTIYINTFKQGESLFSRKNLVFIFAILTTQSTMGVLSLLIPIWLVLMKAISENEIFQRLSVIVVPTLIAVFAVVFLNVDFLSAKLIEEITSVDEEMEMVIERDKDDLKSSVSRTASILIDSKAIEQYPALGLGVDMQTTGESKMEFASMAITACGLTTLTLRFGIIGFIGYMFLYYKKAFFEEKVHRIGWVVTIFFILFSNEISASAFLHMFVF